MSDGEKQEVLRLCRQRLMRKLRANKPASSDEPEQPSLFEPNLAYTPLISDKRKRYGSAYYYCAARPGVFPFCDGLLAIDGLNMSARQLVSFIEEHLDLGVTLRGPC